MWYKIQNQQVDMRILAKPNAKKSALLAITDQGLHIALHAKPHQGEANKALILFLAEMLGIAKSRISLKRGETSRYKQVTLPLTASVQAFIDAANQSSGKLDIK